jgi:hypothetical protein
VSGLRSGFLSDQRLPDFEERFHISIVTDEQDGDIRSSSRTVEPDSKRSVNRSRANASVIR